MHTSENRAPLISDTAWIKIFIKCVHCENIYLHSTLQIQKTGCAKAIHVQRMSPPSPPLPLTHLNPYESYRTPGFNVTVGEPDDSGRNPGLIPNKVMGSTKVEMGCGEGVRNAEQHRNMSRATLYFDMYSVFSPGLESRLYRPALIPDRPALIANRWLEIY